MAVVATLCGKSGGKSEHCLKQRKRSSEEDLSAKHTSPKEKTWVSKADAHPIRESDNCATPQEGPEPALGIMADCRPERLRSKSEIAKVVRDGSREVSDHVRVVALSIEGPACVALAVGRRAGNAVARNRIKRRIRAAVAELGLPEGCAYVVWADSRVERMDYWELLVTLKKLTTRAARAARQRNGPGRHLPGLQLD